MAVLLPPIPYGSPPGSSFWNDWYEKLRTLINTGAVTVTWANINFIASNITDIVNRAHNNLQSIQGGAAGEYYHLTAAQHAALAAGPHNNMTSIQGGGATERYHLTLAQHTVATTTVSKAGTPTTSDIAAGTWAVYKDTSGGTVRIWANDGGVMKSATLT